MFRKDLPSSGARMPDFSGRPVPASIPSALNRNGGSIVIMPVADLIR
jgi:hypothetical protein